MKKIVIIIIVCLCFVGCENENVIEEKPEEKVNEINVNSELFFLENGNEFKNYILLANNDESILKTNYSIKVEYVMENDDKVFLVAKCNVYNSEYSFCMEGTEEFIINGIGQESLDRIFEGGNNAYGTILILAIYFGAAHIHKGVGYMIGASVMCLILCIAYRKQKTIWGISITHYLLGMAAKFLGYI